MNNISSGHLEEFENVKQTNEELVSAYRKSIIPYRYSFLSPFIILLFMTMVGIYVPGRTLIIADLVIGFSLMAILFARGWFLWSRSMVLITNLRIIYLAQRSLFKKDKSEAYLCDICQVVEKVSGFTQIVFKYGDVLVQTQAELLLEDVERPHEVSEAIFEALGPTKHKDVRALPNRFWKSKK